MRSPPGNGLVLLRIHSPRIIRRTQKTLDGTGSQNGATSIDHSLVHWTAAGSERISYIGWLVRQEKAKVPQRHSFQLGWDMVALFFLAFSVLHCAGDKSVWSVRG